MQKCNQVRRSCTSISNVTNFSLTIFEEQTMILMDRAGNRETRKLRRYSRIAENGALNYLLVFDTPSEIQGVAILGSRNPSGINGSSTYLPALKKIFKSGLEDSSRSYLLGTDFSVENLTGEFMSDFKYLRIEDRKIDRVNCYVIDAYPNPEHTDVAAPRLRHRHFMRKDNYFIIRTDYFDHLGRLSKCQTHRDIIDVSGTMWRGDMILMDNKREQHKTLIKIDRRIFSRDYVPTELFTKDWLLSNRHIKTIHDMLIENASRLTTTD